MCATGRTEIISILLEKEHNYLVRHSLSCTALLRSRSLAPAATQVRKKWTFEGSSIVTSRNNSPNASAIIAEALSPVWGFSPGRITPSISRAFPSLLHNPITDPELELFFHGCCGWKGSEQVSRRFCDSQNWPQASTGSLQVSVAEACAVGPTGS